MKADQLILEMKQEDIDTGARFRRSSNLRTSMQGWKCFLLLEHFKSVMNSDTGLCSCMGCKKPYQWNADNVIHHGNK